MTAQAIITMVLKKRKEPIDGSGHWTRDEILSRLNLVQDGLDLILGGLLTAYDTSLTTVASQLNYALPEAVRDVIAIAVNGITIPVVTEDKIESDAQKGIISTDWRTETGDAEEAFIRGGDICLRPLPASAGLTIGITYKVNLTAVTDSASSYPLNTIARIRTSQMLLILYTVLDIAAEEGDSAQMQTIETEIGFYQNPIKRETQLGRKNPSASYKGADDNEEQV